MMTEKIIETQILTWLNCQPNVFAFKINTVGVYDSVKKTYRLNRNRFVMKGCSDILGVAYGRMIAIEVKTPKTIRSILNPKTERDFNQKSFLDQIKRMGGFSLVACQLDDVVSFLNEIKNQTVIE